MKTAQKLSWALNFCLVALVIYLLRMAHSPENASVPTTANVEIAPPETSSPPAPAPSPVSGSVSAPRFRWDQLESTDYRVYITNLRGISCPEQTVRDIITADVDEAFYAPQRKQLQHARAGQDLESALQELNKQEVAFIDALLGAQPRASRVVADATNAPIIHAESRVERDLKRPVALPLALQLMDSGETNLTDTQMLALKQIRQNFLDEIGGTNQDPNDPAYRQRWQVAQYNANEMLGALMGSRFVVNYQMQLQRQAYQMQLEGQAAQSK